MGQESWHKIALRVHDLAIIEGLIQLFKYLTKKQLII